MVATNGLPPDPDIVGEGWYEEWLDRLERTPQWAYEWLRHQQRDTYWLHGSPCANYESIECPTMLIGGWLDGYVDGMLALAEHLTCPTRTVIGPWGHYRPATGLPAPTLAVKSWSLSNAIRSTPIPICSIHPTNRSPICAPKSVLVFTP